MRLYSWITAVSAVIGVGLSPVWAAVPGHQQVKVPACLASELPEEYRVLAQDHDFSIIDLKTSSFDELSLLADKVHCGRFVNVTEQLKEESLAKTLIKSPQSLLVMHKPYVINHKAEVNAALEGVNSSNIWTTLSHLTSYKNRDAKGKLGVQAAEWIRSQFVEMAKDREDTDVYFVSTPNFKQPSVVTVIGKDIKKPAIVIGGHMDTLGGNMPGAGDDGSGSSSIMEVARILLSNNIKLDRPVYIIWYAAEEPGLVGSEAVVREFKRKNIEVSAAIQFDMTGYRPNQADPTIWVYDDYTDPALSNFMAELISTYVKVPVAHSACGYGCSDHASWTEAGVPAAFPCESSFSDVNPYIHSSLDMMSNLNLEHMTNFTKLGLAFAIELASA